MKLKKSKIGVAALCLAACVSLSGCKSAEVKNAEALINDIGGNITLESAAQIEEAESAYKALGEEQKDVGNVKKLEDARSKYDALYQETVAPIEGAISDIPAITADSINEQAKTKIEKARALYDRAEDDVKKAVANYDVLVAAEKEYNDITVKAAVDAIDQIGEVTLSGEDKVNAAVAAYQAVPASSRVNVTNYDSLVAAQSALTKLKQEAAEKEKQQALARLRIEKDTVENINWYYPSSYPKYINTRSFVLPYIGEKDGYFWLRLVFDYAGDDWIFMEQAIVNVDGQVAGTVDFGYMDVQRDTAYGAKLSEVADISPTTSQIEMLRKIAESDNTTIRLKGTYQKDLTVSASDKQGIKDILTYYDAVH